MSKDVPKLVLFVILFLLATAIVGWITPREDLRTLGKRETRQVWNERVHLPGTEPFRHSPFLVDHVFDQHPVAIDLLENRGKWSAIGPAHETFRFYSSGPAVITVDFTTVGSGRTPRVWLYDDEDRLISLGEHSLTEHRFSVQFFIARPGLYLIRMHFHYDDIESLRITGQCEQAKSEFENYTAENLKTLEIQLPAGQLHRLEELFALLRKHWQGLPSGIKGRSLPSPKEAVAGQVRAPNGKWAFASFRLAGRNSAHYTKGGLPSLDVRIEAGELPFGMSKFKLYTLQSKSKGRDMLYESILNDCGLPMYRQDIVRVMLNGKFSRYAQLLETVSPAHFEYAQVQEGAILGYDTDAIIAVPNQSRFLLRSYYQPKLFPAARHRDLSDPEFARQCDTNLMSIAHSFAPTYSGNHGMSNDLRFHVNRRTGRTSPIVKDFNSGVYAANDSRHFTSALMMLGTFAPNWRPHVPSYGSYFVSRNASKEVADGFFWWNVLPSSLNFFDEPSNFANVVRFLKRWDSPQSRRRIQQRLDILGAAIQRLDGKADTELRAVPLMLDVIPHDDFAKLLDYDVASREVSSNEVSSNGRLQYVRQMIRDVTDGVVVPDDHELATLGWRNDVLWQRFTSSDVPLPHPSLGQGPFVTFFYRAELGDTSHLVFLERLLPNHETPPTNLVLLDTDDHSHKPIGYATFGSQVRKISRSNLYLNDVRENECVRLYYFRIDRADDHRYFRPMIEDRDARYFGPHELAVYPYPKPIPQATPFLPLERFFERNANQLRWRADLATVDGPVLIPREMELVVPNSRTVRFGQNGSLIIRGRIRIEADATLTLTAASEQGSWQGIHFHDNDDLRIQRLRVHNVGDGQDSFQIGGVQYSGAVTFANCRATLRNCEISKIQVEDALHALRAELVLDNVKVSNTQSDAIDADYCALTVRRLDLDQIGVSTAIGGDGLDLSGSFANISVSTLNRCSDKGVSVGENSVIFMSGLAITDCNFGVAAKDGSLVDVANCRIEGCQIGIAKYIKKTAFTSPSVNVGTDCRFRQNGRDIKPLRFVSSAQ